MLRDKLSGNRRCVKTMGYCKNIPNFAQMMWRYNQEGSPPPSPSLATRLDIAATIAASAGIPLNILREWLTDGGRTPGCTPGSAECGGRGGGGNGKRPDAVLLKNRDETLFLEDLVTGWGWREDDQKPHDTYP